MKWLATLQIDDAPSRVASKGVYADAGSIKDKLKMCKFCRHILSVRLHKYWFFTVVAMHSVGCFVCRALEAGILRRKNVRDGDSF